MHPRLSEPLGAEGGITDDALYTNSDLLPLPKSSLCSHESSRILSIPCFSMTGIVVAITR